METCSLSRCFSEELPCRLVASDIFHVILNQDSESGICRFTRSNLHNYKFGHNRIFASQQVKGNPGNKEAR